MELGAASTTAVCKAEDIKQMHTRRLDENKTRSTHQSSNCSNESIKTYSAFHKLCDYQGFGFAVRIVDDLSWMKITKVKTVRRDVRLQTSSFNSVWIYACIIG